MAEGPPLPPLPPGVPILLALLSLAGGDTPAGRGPGLAFSPDTRHLNLKMWIQRLDVTNRSELRPLHRGRRAVLRPPPPRKAQAGHGNPVAATPGRGASATDLLVGKTDLPKPFEPGGDGRLTHPASLDRRPSLPTRSMEAGAARTAGCRCLGGESQDAERLQLGKDAKGLERTNSRLPTPRTEEAAWAASALAFLLMVLTLAVLYTRLHRKCRRGRSLYWTTSGEDGHETVAAVLKRRLPASSQARRKKRVRPLQQRPLLSATSSEASE